MIATTTTLREKYRLSVDDEVFLALDRAQDILLDAEAVIERAAKALDAALSPLVSHLDADSLQALHDELEARRKRETRAARWRARG